MAACEKPPANERKSEKVDEPFDEKAWRREYMRKYMRERRLKMKRRSQKDQAS